MVLLELATYFFGAVVSLVVAVFLFGVKIKSKGEGSFYRVKRLLATCASIDVIQYTGNLLCVWNGFDYLLLDKFVVPVVFYVQIYLVSFAFLALLHSRLNVLKYRIILPVPVLLVSAAYVIAYWKFNGWASSMANYISFTETIPARLISALLYAIIILEVILVLVAACVRIIKYREIIGHYFSGQQKISSSKPILLIFAVITYIGLASFDFIASKPAVDMALMWANTILYMSFAIVVLNLQVTYIETSPAFSPSMSDEPSDVGAQLDENTSGEDVRPAAAESDNAADRRYVEDIVRAWSGRDDKPYLKDGITLGSAAAQMGISPRFLSSYINDIYEVNFNTWINMLRIDFVKAELKKGTAMTMSELALKAGFSELAAMSRIFKRLEGETPSQFRNKLSENISESNA
ncbi:MAG: helix-turn-helix domain-containing protein [Bacteroidales bacterium]